MKEKITILADSGLNRDYINFFNKSYDAQFIEFRDIISGKHDHVDLLLFTGGADITPSYYGENRGMYTGNNPARDKTDMFMFNYLKKVPKVGICRGSQLLTVASGGKLIQNVNGHLGNHLITVGKKDYEITSTHHQMLFPYALPSADFKIIAHSKEKRSNTYTNGDDEEMVLSEEFVEPEIVLYPKSKSLAIQGHPEFLRCPDKTVEFCLNTIKSFVKEYS